MNLAEQAYSALTGNAPTKNMSITYSGRFKDYNANVQYGAEHMVFSLSKEWREVSDEIVMGLLQTLMLKTFQGQKRKRLQANTFYIDLYNNFIKNMSSYGAILRVDAVLKESFERVNKRLFLGMMDMPNLVWGGYTTSQLGCYTYANNTVTISKILEDDDELLDFVMYHELLHKKYKFEHRGSRSISHTATFRADEKKFSSEDMDKKLRTYLARKKQSKAKRKKNLLDWFLR